MKQSATGRTVLVVDDDREMTDLLVSALSDAGYAASAADNGATALTVIKHTPPDLVLTDLSMPEMGGLDLVRAARDHHPDTRFIVLTAFGDWPSFCSAQDLKVDAYLTKPISLDALLKQVETALSETVHPASDALEKEHKSC